MGHVAVDILNLREVLLGHLDQLGPGAVLRELGRALLLGRRVLIVVSVLLWDTVEERHRQGEEERKETLVRMMEEPTLATVFSTEKGTAATDMLTHTVRSL